jgi:ubiquitin C-terminal hydrolase
LNGKSAVHFAILLRQIWAGNSSYLSPAKLRELIATKYTHFRGYDQQDTQEFLCSLLSLLHEDLNRVTKKPFYESSLECENDADFNTTQIASESWERFLSRENSVVVDNFYGQFKSKLTCPECQKVSITFEAFNNLLVPIARPKMLVDFIIFFSLASNRQPINVCLAFCLFTHLITYIIYEIFLFLDLSVF